MDNLTKKSLPSGSLPSYRKPPVNEVVCGMRFSTPEKLRLPHIGPLWDKFRADYPNIQHAQPIASTIGEVPIDVVTGFPIPRFWLINRSDDQLVQFQFDRLYFNWRRRQSEYPRYPFVIEQFEHVLHTIEAFLKEYDLGELNPIEYELNYINHIPKGEGWDTIEDLPKIFQDFGWTQRSERFLPKPANITWAMEFPMQGQMGRLIISLKQATRIEDKVPLFVLELSTRGFIGTGDRKVL